MSQDNIQTLRHTVEAFNRGAWDEARLDFDAGDQVFVVVQVSGQGRQSGEETSSPLHALVVRFEAGKILGLTMFMSRDAALQAAGLT